MDFLFTPEQDEAAELAAQILADKTSNERLKEVEAGGDRFDRELWATLGDAFDWAELDLVMLARVLVEVGKRVAPVPLATHAACASLLTGAGLPADRGLYAAAVAEERAHLPAAPTVRASADGALTGTKTLVRAGMAADALLVTATGPDGVGVHLVDATADGVERVAQKTSDGDVAALITFTNAAGTRIGGAEALERLGQLLVALAAAEQLGVTEGALRLTSEYAKTREQFGRPIGTFQAVSQRLADGFIDVLGQRLTLWQAIWRLEEGLPAATEVATAKLWAADAGHRIAHTTVHVHGGVGIDLDGEAHRYFTSGKRFEFLFGGATEQALAIGRSFA
ncbi:acyl-CoA dehydrogenase family protein [Nocardioides kongjuensis]|uniref:Alkylation response protein AidB-like acyl-CoA dehydrogenase n=1 Tax=Nocardioides kongjuensis TaxID=349522 RepID=A0A852R8N3_9ACTN|nr:acyl-CoA dehydrogenase family protein [Nocardioides kongjuensis]NYD29951.1 alkylation response protein AidB-like acyl-CoA dehydrogenase [Nocardioides kongjuensis]